MISENKTRVLKNNTYFYHFYNSLKKIKNIIDELNNALNFIKGNFINEINELGESSSKLNKKIEEESLNQKLLEKREIKIEINLIKDILQSFYANMISVCENNHINKIKNLKNEFNDIMIEMSNLEFDPPNANSFNTSLNKENECEITNSVISMSKLDKNESIQEELILGYNDFLNDYINNDNGYIKSHNNTNNNVGIINNIKIESFHIIYEMNKNKNNSINNILEDEYINKFNLLENSFISDDEIIDVIKNDENDFSKNCNKFFYKICLINKGNNLSINKDTIKNYLLNKLNIKENHIFLSFDDNFMETFIRTKNFSCSSINIIKRDYPNFNKLFEYKMIYDHILKMGQKYFDYNGNTISPNSSLNILRGNEEYDPPYGWFGIGLNIDKYGDKEWIENKTNTSKWAIAYHGIGQLLSYDKVKKKLTDVIVKKDLILTKRQKYKDYNDKRNPGKTIGKGFYLTPKINIAEYFAGIININNKNYKVVLMAKVLIDKIREPEDIEYWILNKDDIRFYRILIKEIN